MIQNIDKALMPSTQSSVPGLEVMARRRRPLVNTENELQTGFIDPGSATRSSWNHHDINISLTNLTIRNNKE